MNKDEFNERVRKRLESVTPIAAAVTTSRSEKMLHALENTTETNGKHDRAQINGRPRHPRPIIINGKAFDIGDAPRCSVHRDKVNPAKSLILWSAPKEARQAGYKPKSKKVWKGVAPNKEECDLIRREAWLLEHEFQVWQRANPVAEPQPPVSLEEHRAKRNSGTYSRTSGSNGTC